jgi:hypothetical protein
MKFVSRLFVVWVIFALVGLSVFTGHFPTRTHEPIIPTAHASVPAFETNPQVLASLGGILNADLGAWLQILFEWAQTYVLTTLKHKLLAALQDQIIGWIQGEGEPQFIGDWKGFLSDAGNEAVGEFIEEIGLEELCSPFKFEIKAALNISIKTPAIPRFERETRCTLNDVINNINDFYDDFRVGSWAALAVTISPQNNFLGSFLAGFIIAETETSSGIVTSYLDGLVGDGFLGQAKCEKDSEGRDIPSTCTTTTPGSVARDLITDALPQDFNFIVNADQLADFVAAIADAAANRLIAAGVEGLLGVSTPSSPEGGVFRGDGACEDLPPEIQQTCEDNEEASGSSVEAAIVTVLDEIELSIGPREDADRIWDDALLEATAYRDALVLTQDAFDSGGAARDHIGDDPYWFLEAACDIPQPGPQDDGCRCVYSEVDEIYGYFDFEIDFVNAKDEQIIINKAANLDAITALIDFRAEIEQILIDLENGIITESDARLMLTRLVNENRDILSASAAETVKASANADLDEIILRHDVVLNDYLIDGRLDYCQGNGGRNRIPPKPEQLP